jgi:hypothetical protein
MNFNLNDAEAQTIFAPVPASLYKLLVKVRSRDLTLAKNLRTSHSEFEFEIVDHDDLDGRKIFDLITLHYNDEVDPSGLLPDVAPEQDKKYKSAVRMGRAKMKALVDSAFEFDPQDKSAAPTRVRNGDVLGEVDGRWCWARVGVHKETAQYKARNYIEYFITKDMREWPGSLTGAPARQSSSAVVPLRDEMNDEIPF